jgi:putative ABC transport system permease protein
MTPLTRKALRDARGHKLRSILTVSGIALGVLGLTGINIASSQLESSFAYSNMVSAHPDIELFTTPLGSAVLRSLARQPNVDLIEGRGYVPALWRTESGPRVLELVGVTDFGKLRLGKFDIQAGSVPQSGQVLMEASDRTLAAVNVGASISIDVAGTMRHLTVSGLNRTLGRPASTLVGSGLAYVREQDLRAISRAGGISDLLIRLHGQRDETSVARDLAGVVRTHHAVVYTAQVGINPRNRQLTDDLLGTIRALSIIAFLLGTVVLIGTMSTLVSEQCQIIGTMKALGGSTAQIMRAYLILVGTYAAVGTAAGFLIGLILADVLVRYVTSILTLDIGPLSVSPWLLLLSVGLGIGVPLAAAAIPIIVGTRVAAIDALRGYGIAQVVRGRTLRLGLLLPPTARMGMLIIFRRRMRSFLSLVALAVSGTAFLVMQTTIESYGGLLDGLFRTYSADLVVNLSQDHPFRQARKIALTVPGVARVENFAQARVDTSWGSGLLTGLEPGTVLYQKDVIKGRWFHAHESGVALISQDAADRSGLRVGDLFSFHTSLYSARVRIIGIARDYNNIEWASSSFGVILTAVDQVAALRRLPPGYGGAMLVLSNDRSQLAVARLADRVAEKLAGAGLPAVVTTAKQQHDQYRSEQAVLYGLLYAVVAVLGLVGALGLFNSLAIGVLERRREIGILRAMGAASSQIGQVLWAEALMLGLFGSLVAALIGVPASYAFIVLLGHLLVPVPFSISALALLTMAVFVLLVSSLAALVPVWRATRVEAAAVLRYE